MNKDYPTLPPFVADARQEEAFADFGSVLRRFLFDGGARGAPSGVDALPVFHSGHAAGFQYSIRHRMQGFVRVGITATGWLMIESSAPEDSPEPVARFYSKTGRFIFAGNPRFHPLLDFPKRDYEPRCPILNFLYTLAELEYAKTREGRPDTALLHLLEGIVRALPPAQLSFSSGKEDPCLRRLGSSLLEAGMDPVLTFSERRRLSRVLREERRRMLETKCRIHGHSVLARKVALWIPDLGIRMACLKRRPRDHLASLLGASLIAPVKSFSGMVRGNLGYSIALAIYSPFTFFFITQPMNPHAMRAVGAVRSAIVGWSETLRSRWPGGSAAVQAPAGLRVSAQEAAPRTAGILLSSDVPGVDRQSWDERMSRFKAMQIAYEGGLEIAPRSGRLEQLETQLNWPLALEGAWSETVRYGAFLSFIQSNRGDYQPEFIRFAGAEENRLDQVQLYLWDRGIRFALDHPYILMDETGEQPAFLFYAGRGFLLLREMTRTLLQRHPDLALPEGYERILNHARRYELASRGGMAGDRPAGIRERLQSRSPVFSRQDPWDTRALRADLKRHWEVLYLLQNRAQEASNAGSQLYVWSVRTMVSLLQTFYSAKREEMALWSLAFKKNAKPALLHENPDWKRIDSQYEALLHQMMLEFVSIRKELGEELAGDIEAVQRKTLLDSIGNFLSEREALLRAPGIF